MLSRHYIYTITFYLVRDLVISRNVFISRMSEFLDLTVEVRQCVKKIQTNRHSLVVQKGVL